MKRLIFVLNFYALIAVNAQVPPAQSSPTKPLTVDEMEKALARRANVMTKSHQNIRAAGFFLQEYRRENDGAVPLTWEVLEQRFGPEMWVNAEHRNDVLNNFALFSGITGRITTKGSGSYEVTLLAVRVQAMERTPSRENKELGRWVLSDGPQGNIGEDWFPEIELQTFTAWPKVQSAIDQYLKNRPVTQSPLQTPQGSPSNPPASKPHGEPAPKVPDTTRTTEPSKMAWLAWLVIALAAIGLLWPILKKRHW